MLSLDKFEKVYKKLFIVLLERKKNTSRTKKKKHLESCLSFVPKRLSVSGSFMVLVEFSVFGVLFLQTSHS